ncbi:MAG: hypothetical protein K1V95_04575 [Eubacterium sp.]
MSNCPKCNKKIGVFYFKQNCPHCNANLMYYDFDNRLKQDAVLAQQEWAAVEKVTGGIKTSSIGSFVAIARLVSFFLPVVSLLLPSFNVNGKITLISIIKQIISDSGAVFSETALMLCFAAMAAVVAFALIQLVVSLFSYTKNGFKRNIVFSVTEIVVFAGLGIAAAATGGTVLYGFFISLALQVLTAVLHFAVKKN